MSRCFLSTVPSESPSTDGGAGHLRTGEGPVTESGARSLRALGPGGPGRATGRRPAYPRQGGVRPARRSGGTPMATVDHTSSALGIDVRPLAGHIGAELHGVDLR